MKKSTFENIVIILIFFAVIITTALKMGNALEYYGFI